MCLWQYCSDLYSFGCLATVGNLAVLIGFMTIKPIKPIFMITYCDVMRVKKLIG